jgi:hypothetical protein
MGKYGTSQALRQPIQADQAVSLQFPVPVNTRALRANNNNMQ